MDYTQINNLIYDEFKLLYALGVFSVTDKIQIIVNTWNEKILLFFKKHEKGADMQGVINTELTVLRYLYNESHTN